MNPRSAVMLEVPADDGEVHRHAMELLRTNGHAPARILQTTRDAILYQGGDGTVRTAFIERQEQDGHPGRWRTIVTHVEEGFPVV